jgi:hypothetical protein
MTVEMTNPALHQALNSGEDLRQQADICRGLADIARTEQNKLFWLRIAGQWVELARSVDCQETQTDVAL